MNKHTASQIIKIPESYSPSNIFNFCNFAFNNRNYIFYHSFLFKGIYTGLYKFFESIFKNLDSESKDLG